jgi:hypothetical protein
MKIVNLAPETAATLPLTFFDQLSGKELARCRTLRLGPSPVPPHKNHS